LKPYVPYKVANVEEPRLKPSLLFDLLHGDKIREEVDKELAESAKNNPDNIAETKS